MEQKPIIIINQEGDILCCNKMARSVLNIRYKQSLLELPPFVPTLVSKIIERKQYTFSLFLDPKTFIFNSEALQLCENSDNCIVMIGQESGKHFFEYNENENIQMIGTMATGLAHEIRSPLQSIRNNLEFLKENTTASNMEYHGEVISCFNETLDAIIIVNLIIDAIKDFSSVDPSQIEETDLCKVIEETLALTKHEWKYDTDILFNPPGEQITLRIARSDLFQIFINLIVNSEHAIQEAIQENLIEKGLITINISNIGNHIVMDFSDNGIGIKPGTEDLIFKPFFTTKKKGLGTGQGLSIIKKIIEEKNKGMIRVESEPEKGTTFVITFKKGPL